MIKFKIKNIILWAILIMFAFGSLYQGNFNVPVIAKVGKERITVIELQKYAHFIASNIGADITSEKEQNYIVEATINFLTEKSLIEQECKNLGLVVSDEKIAQEIKQNPNFYNKNKSFSRDKFLEEIEKFKLTEMEWKEIVRYFLLRAQWEFMLSLAFKVPQKVAKTVAAAMQQMRSGRYLEIAHEKIHIKKPGDAELQNFYEENKTSLKIPEKRDIEIVLFEKLDKKTIPEIEQEAKNNSLIDISKKFNGKFYNSTEAKNIQEEIKPFISYHAKRMQIGQTSNVHRIYGNVFVIFKLKKITPSFVPKFEQIKEILKDQYEKIAKIKKASAMQEGAWLKIKDINLNENQVGLNPNIVKALFLRAENQKPYIFTSENKTYHVVTEKIVNPEIFEPEIKKAEERIKKEIMSEVIEAALKTLQLKYGTVIS